MYYNLFNPATQFNLTPKKSGLCTEPLGTLAIYTISQFFFLSRWIITRLPLHGTADNFIHWIRGDKPTRELALERMRHRFNTNICVRPICCQYRCEAHIFPLHSLNGEEGLVDEKMTGVGRQAVHPRGRRDLRVWACWTVFAALASRTGASSPPRPSWGPMDCPYIVLVGWKQK